MTHDRYEVALEQIDEMLTQRHKEGLGPGLALALTTADTLLATRTYGVTNADTKEPVTDVTIFQIGSISKHFTAIACLRLVEQGRLDVDAPVTEYLDWFEVESSFATPITIHHLLTHTAGLVMMIDGYPSSWWQVWALRDTRLGFEPGARFSYSNVGYNVLQCVIQTITGKTLDGALRELVFEPLDMADTYGQITVDRFARMAKGHRYSSYDDRPVPRPKRQTVVNEHEMSEGCGSVVTTAAELARFLRMLLRRGVADDGSRFLAPETFERMIYPHAEMDGLFAGTTQGYGVLIEESEATGNRPRILGGGENLGFEAAMYGDFDAGVGVVLFCNSFDVAWAETRWILDTLIAASRGEALPERPTLRSLWPQPIGEKASDYVGTYASEDRSFSIAAEDGHLGLVADGAQTQLEPLYGESFLAPLPGFDGAMLTFGRDDEGRVVEAFQLGEWFRNERYEGPTQFATPPAWDGIVGQYRSPGLLFTNFRVFSRKGQLYCQSYGGYVDAVLTDLGDAEYTTGDEASAERMRFDSFAGGKALRCLASGAVFYRTDPMEAQPG